MNVADVRAGLAAALGVISDVQISPYVLSQPTPPTLQIIPPSVQYDLAMHRGLDEWMFTVQGLVAFSTDLGPQLLLDAMCAPTGASSVKAALEADRTLGGVVGDLHVLEQLPGALYTHPNTGSQMLLVEWRVKVLVTGN